MDKIYRYRYSETSAWILTQYPIETWPGGMFAAGVIFEEFIPTKSSMFETIRSFSNRIKNGRTPASTLAHLRSEVEELDIEVKRDDTITNAGGTAAHDGIIGEAMDIVNCAIDIVLQVNPNIDEATLAAIQHLKCTKWMQRYSNESTPTS